MVSSGCYTVPDSMTNVVWPGYGTVDGSGLRGESESVEAEGTETDNGATGDCPHAHVEGCTFRRRHGHLLEGSTPLGVAGKAGPGLAGHVSQATHAPARRHSLGQELTPGEAGEAEAGREHLEYF